MTRLSATIEELLITLANHYARTQVRNGAIPSQDREDFKHDIVVRTIPRLEQNPLPPGREAAWLTTLIQSAGSNILREQRTQKRGYGQVIDGDIEFVAEFADQFEDTINRRIDVAEAMANLPEDDSRLVDQLKTCSKSEMARNIGVSPTTVARRIQKVRHHFICPVKSKPAVANAITNESDEDPF